MALLEEYQGLVDLVVKGHLQVAEPHALALLAKYPALGNAWTIYGIICSQLNRPEDALSACQKAVAYLPGDAGALAALAKAYLIHGAALQNVGRLEDAVGSYQRSLELMPDNPDTLNNLGSALQLARRFEEAIAVYDRCLALEPADSSAHNNRGVALQLAGRLEEAIVAFNRCLELNPDSVDASGNLGSALQVVDRLDEAIAVYRRCLELKPDYLDIQFNLGAVLKDEGLFDQAISSYERCLELAPEFVVAQSNLLFCLNYRPDIGKDRFVSEHLRWDEIHGMPDFHRSKEFGNSLDPNKRMRIGLVSADLRRHPVGFLLLPILSRLDPERVEVSCYSGVTVADCQTERFKRQVSLWRDTIGIADDHLAEMIEEDGIDILIDLAGHTAGNRLTLFALRPAPVQISWMGYWATTGMRAMDYIIMDRHTVPDEAKGYFTEEILYLPENRFCYEPLDDAPQVGELPALARGEVTFGSFNNLAKVNLEVIELWAAVLKGVPGSRLVLKWKSLVYERKREQIYQAFSAQGVDRVRVELRGCSPHIEMLGEYGDIDIALDPFPFSGGMTSCEALWMGVPVLTLPGPQAVSRQSYAFLKNIGLEECIAANRDDYVARAGMLAGDLVRLSHLRQSLRERMRRSPLCDGERSARNLEGILREVWSRWCTAQGAKDRCICE